MSEIVESTETVQESPQAGAEGVVKTTTDSDDKLLQESPETLARLVREARKEAAGHRAKFKEAEHARELLAGQLATWQAEQVRRAGEAADVASVALDGLGEFVSIDQISTDGKVDEEKASAVFAELKQQRPYLFKQAPRLTSSGEVRGGIAGGNGSVATWADVLG